MRHGLFVLATVALTLPIAAANEGPERVSICFRTTEGLARVQRIVPSGADPTVFALSELAAGPTPDELAAGLTSAIPAGTALAAYVTRDGGVTIEFSEGVLLLGMDDARLEAIVEQVRATLWLFDFDGSVRLTTGGRLLSEYLPAVLPVSPSPQLQLAAPTSEPLAAPGSALSGKKISLSPGHGLKWGGSSWTYDRPVYCSPLSREDHHNIDLAAYLNAFLAQDGATMKVYRCLDKNAGNYSVSGQPWWYMNGSYWLQNIGYPCSVYSSSSGNCTLGSGASEDTDNIRSRPVASDYDNTTIHISIHTNGLSGDCTGSGCPNGTATYYDNSSEHSTWGAISLALAQDINNAVVDVIRTKYTDSTWRNRGAIDADGDFAETRIPNRAAILIELGFHDTCDRDGLYLRDNYFRSATMWGMYKGVCDYFGATPTFGYYSDEYVSDTIPTTMEPGQVVSASVTFRNRGVLWNETEAYRLGAVGDSDPFATATRVAISGEVGTGQTYTFTFNLTAPSTAGTYTTDWQMVRDGFTWFGATCSRQIVVSSPFSPADFDRDTDVDQEDFGHFQACLTGPAGPILSGCETANLENDAVINQADFTKFFDCMLGPGVTVEITCGT